MSPEGRSAGFIHAFVMDFAGPTERDAYLSHPDYVAAATKLVRAADGEDGILVVDFAIP
ncbi:Dabb family protein (plasmid) [Methylobacterium sp. NMS14P]|uniref:Dabb family protein n=1 Tax=Methylobacterium sp. NMS14P TaxID=2894310 RepID=UPI002358EB08|nr:Dabb family protein [Methylobacterium sp. NMS14P]WCS28457.1 Dabb family protein [Methylobacterium sp. NMS14P]